MQWAQLHKFTCWVVAESGFDPTAIEKKPVLYSFVYSSALLPSPHNMIYILSLI